MSETDLYEPIKRFLEAQGYAVKAEVAAADVVAVRGRERPVIVELKQGFSLALFHQATERQALTDAVYVAVRGRSGAPFRKGLKRNLKLCRQLGLGLITIRERDQLVTVHLDPAPYRPRISKRRQTRLLGEFVRRDGDPNVGGSSRRKLVTAYRQDATRCARCLAENGPTKAALVAELTGVPRARRIMSDNHYGWFRRAGHGVYELDPEGDFR
jgi:hypothetical protein